MKRFTLLVLSLVLVFILAACGGNNKNNSSNTSAEKQPAKDNAAVSDDEKPITLKIIHWQNEGTNTFYEEFNKKFTEKYPHIKVDYTTVPSDATYDQLQQTRINANDTDLLAIKSGFASVPQDWSPGAQDPLWKQWIDNGLIADLSNEGFVDQYNQVDVQNSTTYNGKVYGINLGKVSFTGLFYNKTIFADNGLMVPTTWEEFTQVVADLKAKSIDPIGFAGKDVWPINLAVQGLQASIHNDQLGYIKGLWDGSTKWTDPVALEVLDKSQWMMQNAISGFMGVDYGSLPGLFASGKVAMIADGSWDAPAIATANPDLKFGYFPIPGSSDPAKNKDLAGKYDMSWMVLEKAKNKDAALKWLAMHSETEHYTDFVNASGFLPTQDNIPVNSEFIKELAPYLTSFKLAWDQLFINRQNVGEYAGGSSVHAEFLSPAGPLKTSKELADKSQSDWDAAK
jgi:raffinose/stachyose/melibiose transport system substrate-binding protein